MIENCEQCFEVYARSNAKLIQRAEKAEEKYNKLQVEYDLLKQRFEELQTEG